MQFVHVVGMCLLIVVACLWFVKACFFHSCVFYRFCVQLVCNLNTLCVHLDFQSLRFSLLPL